MLASQRSNVLYLHTEIEAADQTCYLNQSQYADTGPTKLTTDAVTPGAAVVRVAARMSGVK